MELLSQNLKTLNDQVQVVATANPIDPVFATHTFVFV